MRIDEIIDSDKEHADTLSKTGFWGKQGAGCLFYCDATDRYLIAHRSRHVQEPGTWGTWGGAIDSSEQPLAACKREVGEETGYSGPAAYQHLWTFKSGSFQYHNFLVTVPQEFDPQLDWENQGFAWVKHGEWPSPLHPGLKALIDSGTLKTSDDSVVAEDQVDMFPQDFATKRNTINKQVQVSSKGDMATVKLPNINSRGYIIAQTKQALQNFWNWFGHSDAVDTKGRPLVFYHGTGSDVSQFKTMIPTKNTDMMGDEYDAKRAGIFFTIDPKMGAHFANRAGGNIVQTYLKMQHPADFTENLYMIENALDAAGYNVRMINSVQYMWELFDEEYGGPDLVAALKKAGYDSAIIWDDEPVENGKSFKSYVVFSGNQVKSVLGNKGTYNDTADIVNEVTYHGNEFYETYGELSYDDSLMEAEYQGRTVKLNKPMRGDVKKFKVYVKNEKGNVIKVNFGDPDMKIKAYDPTRRKSFRARHNCDNPGPKTGARYWSCKKW